MEKRNYSRFVTHAILILFLTIGMFAGISVDADAATLSISNQRDPESMDPIIQWPRDIAPNMFVPLVGYDFAIGKTYPRGAESWTTSKDGLTWTFNIRKNWNWSDGKPVTAHDYVYSLKENLDPKSASVHAWRLYIIKNAKAIHKGKMEVDKLGVRAIDDHTLEIVINSPATWFLSSLASTGYAVPKWVREKHGQDWTKPENIVVCGPYKVVDWKPSNAFILEKNPSYYDFDKVPIDKINYYIIPTESTAMAMFENGELDLTLVMPEDIKRIQGDPVLSKQLVKIPLMRVYGYCFTASKPPFDKADVRKALAMAVDKKTLVKAITRRGEIPADTITPPGCFGHIPPGSGIGIPYNPAEAKKLLAEAGYPEGKNFPAITLGYNASEYHGQIAQAVQMMWKQNLGIEVELSSHEGGGYGKLSRSGGFNIFRQGWGMDYPDANNVHAELFHSSLGHKAFAVVPEYDSIVTQAGAETDDAKRIELYKKAEKIFVEDNAAYLPLFYRIENWVINPKVKREITPAFFKAFWRWSKD